MKCTSEILSLRFVGIATGLFALFAFSACESSQKPSSTGARESSIPWNRPASWEGPGVYGSALGQGR